MDEVIEAMYNLFKKLRKEEDGQSLVMVALLFAVLLGFSALVIDVGMLYVTKAELQNAADAGALAGAAVPIQDAERVAKDYVRFNGVDDNIPGTTIEVDPDTIVGTEQTTTTEEAFTSEELDEMRTELTASLTANTDEELIALAEANSIAINSQSKKIDDMDKKELKKLADTKGIDISGSSNSNLNKDLTIKENKIDEVKEILKKTLGNSEIPTSLNKNELIEALVAKQMSELGSEVIEVSQITENFDRVAVRVTKPFSYIFARIFRLQDTTVSAYAVAEKSSWNGEALPFINLNGSAEDSVKGQPLSAWEKVGPGDKERISNDDLVVSSDNTNIKVNYEDGILFKKGKVMSKIKTALDNILEIDNTVYLFSLKHSVMPDYEKKAINELGNGMPIPLDDIVLLECKVSEWDGKIVSLKFENYYHYDNSSGTFLSNEGTRPSGSPKLMSTE